MSESPHLVETGTAVPAPVGGKFQIPVPEVILALAYIAIGLAIGSAYGLPMSLPAVNSLAFTGMSNTAPAIVIAVGLVVTFLTQRLNRTLYFVTALTSYCAMLVIHFNIKLWVPLINPAIWDEDYWAVDQAARPLLDAAFALRQGLASLFPVDRLYLFAFLSMFGISMIVHATREFPVFRKVVLSAMLVHMLGGLSYLIAPAVGPFLFEHGFNPIESARQVFMEGGYRATVEGGAPWLAAHGSEYLAAGIGAMPSLHVASSAVFVYFAWAHQRYLCWLYFPLFGFIIIESMATRWHYLVDDIAGLALTTLAILTTEFIFRRWPMRSV